MLQLCKALYPGNNENIKKGSCLEELVFDMGDNKFMARAGLYWQNALC